MRVVKCQFYCHEYLRVLRNLVSLQLGKKLTIVQLPGLKLGISQEYDYRNSGLFLLESIIKRNRDRKLLKDVLVVHSKVTVSVGHYPEHPDEIEPRKSLFPN